MESKDKFHAGGRKEHMRHLRKELIEAPENKERRKGETILNYILRTMLSRFRVEDETKKNVYIRDA